MFGRQIKLFTVFGFTVRIDMSWLVIAVLITWTLATGVFPQLVKGLSEVTYWIMGLGGALGLFFSVLFHELSHSLVARRHGLEMNGITLFIFGGVAEMPEEPRTPMIELLMAIAGPASSVLLSVIFFAVAFTTPLLGWPEPVRGVVSWLGTINIMLAIFNMVPGFPLDGGRVLRALLWMWKDNLSWATRIAARVGSGFAMVLMGVGLLNLFFTGNFVGAFWYLLLGMFLNSAANSSYQRILMQDAFAGQTVARFMTPDPITVPPSATVQQLVDDYIYTHHFKTFPVQQDDRLLGCISTEQVRQVPRQEWPSRTVQEVMRSCPLGNIAYPGESAMEALEAMNRNGEGRLLVVEGDHLVGVITLRDLLGYLSMKHELEGGR